MMSNGNPSSLDEAYFGWLYSLVASNQNRDPSSSHRSLLFLFFQTSFNGFVPNDDNRSADGKDLRIEFLQSTGFPLYDPRGEWFDIDCTMLEMIIALSRRVSYEDETKQSPLAWFWRLIGNLELEKYTDDIFEISLEEEVIEKLDRLNNRTYLKNGSGGLFPLRRPKEDQRTVELWTQMFAYLLEGTYAGSRPSW